MYEYTQTVKIVLHDKVSKSEVKGFVQDAVDSWGGQYHWENPFFSPVKVTTPGKCETKEKL